MQYNIRYFSSDHSTDEISSWGQKRQWHDKLQLQ